jgi:hypothetical protein
MEIPKPVVIKTNYTKIYDLLKSSKDGYTIYEIFQKTRIDPRRAREVMQQLRVSNDLKEKKCRCTRTPIYYL